MYQWNIVFSSWKGSNWRIISTILTSCSDVFDNVYISPIFKQQYEFIARHFPLYMFWVSNTCKVFIVSKRTKYEIYYHLGHFEIKLLIFVLFLMWCFLDIRLLGEISRYVILIHSILTRIKFCIFQVHYQSM